MLSEGARLQRGQTRLRLQPLMPSSQHSPQPLLPPEGARNSLTAKRNFASCPLARSFPKVNVGLPKGLRQRAAKQFPCSDKSSAYSSTLFYFFPSPPPEENRNKRHADPTLHFYLHRAQINCSWTVSLKQEVEGEQSRWDRAPERSCSGNTFLAVQHHKAGKGPPSPPLQLIRATEICLWEFCFFFFWSSLS